MPSPSPDRPGHLPAALDPSGAILVYVGGKVLVAVERPPEVARVRDRAIGLLGEILHAPGAWAVTPRDVARSLEVTDKIARLEAGRSTENIATRCPSCGARDLSRLTDEQLDAFEALEAIARGALPTVTVTVGPPTIHEVSDPDDETNGKA